MTVRTDKKCVKKPSFTLLWIPCCGECQTRNEVGISLDLVVCVVPVSAKLRGCVCALSCGEVLVSEILHVPFSQSEVLAVVRCSSSLSCLCLSAQCWFPEVPEVSHSWNRPGAMEAPRKWKPTQHERRGRTCWLSQHVEFCTELCGRAEM